MDQSRSTNVPVGDMHVSEATILELKPHFVESGYLQRLSYAAVRLGDRNLAVELHGKTVRLKLLVVEAGVTDFYRLMDVVDVYPHPYVQAPHGQPPNKLFEARVVESAGLKSSEVFGMVLPNKHVTLVDCDPNDANEVQQMVQSARALRGQD